ncbi:alpha-glucosidase [Weissella halotolerans DSM 20190]|uniref:Alpha-glucosidase n=2 Tax=Weissella halotolerans TaxID=1615 RepID=A0A0R2FYG2_9LACO|nr:alpha-glucosidase [Weissella halotolerans DSM 20190]
MMKAKNWWHDEIVYQIYPRSFQDSNHDGIGDLQGIIQRLDYIASLGVTMIWLSPIYQSPMVDMGYDIADYQAIDPQFGTMTDFEDLVAAAKQRGIKIMMDLVVNHTSDQHAWFQAALADPKSPYRDYYIFKKTDDGQVPNNWRSLFGGSTWTEVPGEPGTYYFHTFASAQPDLNWENETVRQAIYAMIRWWSAKGVAGWRVDAITHLKKDLDWKSLPADGDDGLVTVIEKGQNRPGIESFLTELKDQAFAPTQAMTVGEAYGVPDEDLGAYIGPDGYFSTIFDFSYMNLDMIDVNEWYRGQNQWTVAELRDLLFHSQATAAAVDGRLANVLENHDQPRVLSKLIRRLADQTPLAAKALAVMYYFLPGVPFIYQGQELGMRNAKRERIDDFNDVSSLNNYRMALKEGYSPAAALSIVNAKSRDNARVPMQWTSDVNGGFSDVSPWLPMGTDRQGIDVASEEENSQSVLHFYRLLADLRKSDPWQSVFIDGELLPLDNLPANVVAYQRALNQETVLVVVNLGSENISIALPQDDLYQLLLSNQESSKPTVQGQLTLTPYAAFVLGRKESDKQTD